MKKKGKWVTYFFIGSIVLWLMNNYMVSFVSGVSMQPILNPFDIVICKRHPYEVEIEVGDIVVVDLNNRLIIKRVAGISGDKVVDSLSAIPEHSVFILGDNADVSLDSRMFGCLPLKNIKGKVINILHLSYLWR